MTTPLLDARHIALKVSRDMRRSLRYLARDILAEAVPGLQSDALRPGEFWALEDVSLQLHPGESLAVLGHNGSGKSTLMRVLAGLVKPNRGEVTVRGQMEALIELGAGFIGPLSGKENLLLDAARHGYTPRETDALTRRVLDFSELGAAIDRPYQSYSSGMKSRLAYAIAAHLRPEIFLIDEALAVGDLAFQRKCIKHMRTFLETGGALILVSHNPYQVQSVCQRGIVLDHGRQAFSGSAVEAVACYLEQRQAAVSPAPAPTCTEDPLSLLDVRIEGASPGVLRTLEPARITMHYLSRETAQAQISFSIWTIDEQICVTSEQSDEVHRIGPGPGALHCTIPRLPLSPGRYILRCALLDPFDEEPLALVGWKGPSIPFQVTSGVSVRANIMAHIGQLVTVDVHWH